MGQHDSREALFNDSDEEITPAKDPFLPSSILRDDSEHNIVPMHVMSLQPRHSQGHKTFNSINLLSTSNGLGTMAMNNMDRLFNGIS